MPLFLHFTYSFTCTTFQSKAQKVDWNLCGDRPDLSGGPHCEVEESMGHFKFHICRDFLWGHLNSPEKKVFKSTALQNVCLLGYSLSYIVQRELRVRIMYEAVQLISYFNNVHFPPH